MPMPGKRKLLREKRQTLGASNRLNRLQTLRKIGSPAWIIKLEQVKMVCNRKGFRGDGNRLYATLFIATFFRF